MKRTRFIVVLAFVTLAGCNFGRSNTCSSPNMFSRMCASLRGGSNVGAPCASGGCASGGFASAPAMAGPAIANDGCAPCAGGTTAGYESYEGAGAPSFDSYLPAGNAFNGNVENVMPVPAR